MGKYRNRIKTCAQASDTGEHSLYTPRTWHFPMLSAPKPADESERLAELQALAVLDTLPEAAFDDLTQVAAELCGTPIALVSLVDGHRQWFKSHHGLAATETPRDVAFCAHAILQDDLFTVPDALADTRFVDNPLVIGEPRVRFYAGAPLSMPSGQRIGTLCVIDHEPRQLSASQQRTLRALGRAVVAQLELRRAFAELVQARDAALKTAELKSRFFATVSHELRTPMNGVLGTLDLLREEDLSSNARHLLGVAYDSAGSLLGKLNDVLELSRADAGRLQLVQAPFDPRAELDALEARFRPQAEARGLRFKVEGTTYLPSLLVGDGLRLRQVLAHLLANALEFTTAGSVQLAVGCVADAQEATLTYAVTDTGPGIAASRLQSIFEPFEQADPDRATRFQGTGLGLAVSAALARLLGGVLTVTSREGAGSTFTLKLTLPLAAAPLAAGSGGLDVQAAAGAQTAPRTDAPLAGLQVLLADDNEVNLLVAKRTVERFGCVVTQAKDGREALARAGEQAFAIILMDCQMPELDGYGASRQIRDGGGPNARTPILALTASAFPEDRVRCAAAGMDELVAKPFRREDLEAAMLRHVARR